MDCCQRNSNLKSAVDYRLLIKKCSPSQIYTYSDADWAGCQDDRKSTLGYCIFLGKNLLSWSSKKQSTISRSSIEAEYKAIANVIAEILWIQSLYRELAISLSTAPLIYCDNIGVTYLSSNPAFHAYTKYIEINYYFVRDLVAEKALIVKFISSHDQIANILTKPLVFRRYCMLRSNLNVCSTLRLTRHIEAQDKEMNKILDKDSQTVLNRPWYSQLV